MKGCSPSSSNELGCSEEILSSESSKYASSQDSDGKGTYQVRARARVKAEGNCARGELRTLAISWTTSQASLAPETA